MVTTAFLLIAAYLLGSIPFSYLVARRRGVDVRQVGSGNVGATNVMRSAGVGAGLAAFALDFLKGAAATALARILAPEEMIVAAGAALLAVIGHVFPVWLGWKGGKGVATGAGAFLPLAPLATGLAILVCAIVVALTRYVSAGSIVGTMALAAIAFVKPGDPAVALSATGASALIVFNHRGNIARLRRGDERRIGAAKDGGPGGRGAPEGGPAVPPATEAGREADGRGRIQ